MNINDDYEQGDTPTNTEIIAICCVILFLVAIIGVGFTCMILGG